MKKLMLIISLMMLMQLPLVAQELNATVEINTEHVQGTNKSVFDNLKASLTQFINERHWTGAQYELNERIKCSFNIIVNKYNESNGLMTCEAYIQSSRPVFNSSYITTTLSIHDTDFNFEFQEFDQLEFRDDQVDNNLTALIAYYAYLIIGIDMDTMSPEGGTDVLEKAVVLVNNAQNLNAKGWKAFDKDNNRYGIINDYMAEALKPFRQLQYDYHRKGLDNMAKGPDQAREEITASMDQLEKAYFAKTRSALPKLFTEYKRDELVGIYQGKETTAKKQKMGDLLKKINASQSAYWKKMLEQE